MAAQYEVIFSSELTGAGIVAGGMYYCTEGTRFRVPKCGVSPSLLGLDDDVDDLVQQAKKFAKQGLIDPIENVKSHKLFMFSGKYDKTIAPAVMEATRSVYLGYGVPAENIITEFSFKSPHAWPTLNYGGECNSFLSGPPFMINCGRDFPGEILKHTLNLVDVNPRGVQKSENLMKFSQTPFASSSADMADEGYVYLPDGCREGSQTEACRIHVAFHGCAMSASVVDDRFVRNSGLNEWAESNNIVVLYPQVAVGLNLGCWDYISSTGDDFHTKSGKQVRAVNNMVKHLKSGTVALKPASEPPTTTVTTTTTVARGGPAFVAEPEYASSASPAALVASSIVAICGAVALSG